MFIITLSFFKVFNSLCQCNHRFYFKMHVTIFYYCNLAYIVFLFYFSYISEIQGNTTPTVK